MRRIGATLLITLVGCSGTREGTPVGFDWPLFHGDRARTGWNAAERELSPAAIAGGRFGHLWDSPELDHVDLNGSDYPPHFYASPLYDDATRAVLLASSNGWAYALSSADGHLHWKRKLTDPTVVPGVDGNIPLGVLGTPALDVMARRLYVVSLAAGGPATLVVFALDVDTGTVVDGWPLTLDPASVGALDTNGPATFVDATLLTQRGALNLSPDGGTLYVPIGTTTDHGSGWMLSVDTQTPHLIGSFSVTPLQDASIAGAGIWGSGGPAVDASGAVFNTTGNADETLIGDPHVWGTSLLAWAPSMQLAGSYSPWNWCQLERADTDLGGSSPTLLPDLDPSTTSTPHLIAFGGKQGNVYLVDRDHLPGALDRRPPCSTDPGSDRSLLPPGPQPQFGGPGPLNVFGPYSEIYGNTDRAKMRSTLAHYVDEAGNHFLFASGASKATVDSTQSVPPSVARLKVNLAPGQPAYLSIDALDSSIAFINPGPPVVTSNGPSGPVVWVLDENQQRVASLVDPNAPRPILYAVDGASLSVLWKSGDGELRLSGKYNTPLVLASLVMVATDRLQAFGLR